MFKTLSEGQRWIESIHRFGDKYNLDRMEKACVMLGHPEKQFKSIHIGGTNGKGSTLTYLKHIYLAAGYTVGTYTSPYVVRFNERISYNGHDIDDETLLDLINDIFLFNQTYLETMHDQITFFELVTLMSFIYFSRIKPDIVLIEVGLGGTLDATNVIHPLASVITTIGYDHMHVLGDTLEAIADNKLGIVKRGTPLFTGVVQPDLRPQFEAKVRAQGGTMHHLDEQPIQMVAFGQENVFTYLGDTYTIHMAGAHQIRNAALAVLVARMLDVPALERPNPDIINQGLKQAHWPGRFERFGSVILDGAHNVDGLITAIDTAKAYYPEAHLTMLFTVFQDKDYQKMLKLLEAADAVVFTEIDHPRCTPAEKLYAMSTHPNKRVIPTLETAFEQARPTGEQAILLVTGSLYLISAVRNLLIKA
ncbi:MAG: bifunctional folylpolyglutamate synthase/dihydrofolate synthase [Acholeplasmatales bacterium]|nr:MAG: bifunctional folylpolyglutamate synthase/dihydrofolate synthase [Acholeplasmatales bacterium]